MAALSITRDQSRWVDQLAIEEFGIPGVVLMENAGRGCADLLVEFQINGPVVIFCGKGNNAGDGFVIARHLALRGYDSQVLLWGEPDDLSGDAAVNFQIIRRTEIPIDVFPTAGFADRWEDALARIRAPLDSADWIVDALLGTGARGDPRPPLDRVIDLINRTGCRKLAVDVPSGLDCDTGVPSGRTLRAEHTATFVAPKPGLLAPAAAEYVGRVHVLDIGAPREVLKRVVEESR